ncbi:MAG: protein kinase domain-containing protein [Janthinobacterium lividum]
MAVSSNTVLGKYRIVREIARSNDIVYEAIDPIMTRRVAVKELQLPPHLAGAQKRERIERFYREAKAAGTLSHRNIVTIHDVGQENDRHFLVMEYLEGQSLRDILQMQGALPLKETIEITLQLCDALAYAHSRGVVHRDVKPDNVHILPGGIVKLTDFGIARITAEPSITSQGQVFGTPSYMSPEQVASHTVDHRTDLFSLGITLYEMLSGRKPFIGDSVITITYNIMNMQPTMPVGLPGPLQQILQRALSKDPNLRYQNAAALAADLRAEKFSLTALPQSPGSNSAFSSQTPLSFMSGPPLTLDTGTVPPEISGMPAALPAGSQGAFEQTQAYGGQSAAPAPRRFLTAETERILRFALPVLGVLALLALIAWGLRTVVVSLQAHRQQAQAVQLTYQGATALHHGNYTDAARAYSQAAAAAPPDSQEAHQAIVGQSQAYTGQGQAALRANNLSAAADAYQNAVSLDSQNAEAADNLGNVRWQLGDAAGALDAWGKAAGLDPTGAAGTDARTNAVRHSMDLAQAAANSGNFTQARDFWQKVTEIDPGSDDAFRAEQNISRTDSAPSH